MHLALMFSGWPGETGGPGTDAARETASESIQLRENDRGDDSSGCRNEEKVLDSRETQREEWTK